MSYFGSRQTVGIAGDANIYHILDNFKIFLPDYVYMSRPIYIYTRIHDYVCMQNNYVDIQDEYVNMEEFLRIHARYVCIHAR